MLLFTYRRKSCSVVPLIAIIIVMIMLLLALTCHQAYAAKQNHKAFSSPKEAVSFMVEAMKTSDTGQLLAVLGHQGRELLSSGGDRSGRLTGAEFLKAYEEMNRLELLGSRKAILHIGKDDWPWPIPVVKAGQKWHFDVKEGKKEMRARTIGANELAAIQVCLAYVDAQREYAQEHRVNGVMEYAQEFVGNPEKQGGLCEEEKATGKPGPLGPLIGKACKRSYSRSTEAHLVQPYHGYFYSILKKQGKSAPGGVYNYVVDGKMIGGFALVAYPASYGSSGVMTFIVNQDGVVYEKNMGKNTEKIAEAMDSFDPDQTWKKVE